MRFLSAFLLFLVLLLALSFGTLRAEDKPAAESAAQPPNLLEQLDTEAARRAAPPETKLTPKLSDPLLNKDKKRLPYKNFDEIPEEAVKEAQQVEKDCAADPMLSTYFDCECRAMRFLEARLERGPIDDAGAVMLDIKGECPNTPAIAGAAYKTCIEQGISFFPSGQDPEEYCSCVGRSYAKLYARAGQDFDTQLIVELKTMATLSCTKQEPGVPVLVPPIK